MPFTWLYCPVMMLARLGVQIELLQKTLLSRMPWRAIESMFGVGAKSFSRPW